MRPAFRVAGTAAAVLMLDLWTKAAALSGLCAFKPVPVVPGFFNLTLVFNRGAAFGMFPGGVSFFIVLALVTAIIILWFAAFHVSMPPLTSLALGLICGGALGNLLDRIRFGYVIDFLDFYAGHWHWPAFNIADSCLCIGAGLLILQSLRKQPGRA